MSREQSEMRKHARDDLIRVIQKQAIKEGKLPRLRDAEALAHKVANLNDKRKDIK